MSTGGERHLFSVDGDDHWHRQPVDDLQVRRARRAQPAQRRDEHGGRDGGARGSACHNRATDESGTVP